MGKRKELKEYCNFWDVEPVSAGARVMCSPYLHLLPCGETSFKAALLHCSHTFTLVMEDQVFDPDW